MHAPEAGPHAALLAVPHAAPPSPTRRRELGRTGVSAKRVWRLDHRVIAPAVLRRYHRAASPVGCPQMTTVVDFRDLSAPIVQAGMGAVARHELAAAVSEAGGLGTIGGARAPIAAELAAARRLTDRPIAVNLVLALLRPRDVQAAASADVIVTFWGEPRRLAGGTWVHQCGSVKEARAAEAAGADAVIAQGVEAGGHVRGTTPVLELVERVRAGSQDPDSGGWRDR